jgi:hypothetical protein
MPEKYPIEPFRCGEPTWVKPSGGRIMAYGEKSSSQRVSSIFDQYAYREHLPMEQVYLRVVEGKRIILKPPLLNRPLEKPVQTER